MQIERGAHAGLGNSPERRHPQALAGFEGKRGHHILEARDKEHLRQRLQGPESIPECGCKRNVYVIPCNLPPSANIRQPVVDPETRISIQALQTHQSNSSEQVLFTANPELQSGLACHFLREPRQGHNSPLLFTEQDAETMQLMKRHCLRSSHSGDDDLQPWPVDLSVSGTRLERRRPPVKPRLLDPCAAALNQQNQHDDKQNAGDNSDNRSTVHKNFLSPPKVLHSLLQSIEDLGASQRNSSSFFGAAGIHTRSELLDPCAATLNKQNQHDDKQSPSHYSNNCRTVHLYSSFPQWPPLSNLNESIIEITAGPRATRNSDGKMKNTSGKISLMVVLAAASSTACTRWVLRVSE